MTRENEKLRLYFRTNNVEARHQLLLCKIENEIVSGSFGLSYLLFILTLPILTRAMITWKRQYFWVISFWQTCFM